MPHNSVTMLTHFIPVVQVGGFLQRIDYVRKYAFGVMCILKNSEGQFPIRGFWIFRGQDIPQMMKDECYDLELYDWQKLDSKNLNPVSLALMLLHCVPFECAADLKHIHGNLKAAAAFEQGNRCCLLHYAQHAMLLLLMLSGK